jgi:hypothetical protein
MHLLELMVKGGMFIPFTFIVVEARAHGMSTRLANYLVPILNGARLALSLTHDIKSLLTLAVSSDVRFLTLLPIKSDDSTS